MVIYNIYVRIYVMRINKIYQSLLDKSISSMLAAIEIYNKPNIEYREDTFAILAVNAWELLLKAVMFKYNGYRLHSIYEMKPKIKKDGNKSKIKEPALNRTGNPKTLSIFDVMNFLYGKRMLVLSMKNNIDALIELRDNSIHFANMTPISKKIQEIGFATIKNYLQYIREHKIELDVSKYNFYLMPLAYVNEKVIVDSVMTTETTKYVDYVKSLMERCPTSDSSYDIAISIDVKFDKKSSFDSLACKMSKDGTPVYLKEEDFRAKYPLTYRDIMEKSKLLYRDFKADNTFKRYMKEFKTNERLSHERRLDEQNVKSPNKFFYSSGVFQELDKYYTRK